MISYDNAPDYARRRYNQYIFPTVAASTTATLRPFSPFQIQANAETDRAQQWQQNQPQLSTPRSAPAIMQQRYGRAQVYKEIEDKALDIADKAAMTLPVPYVGETVGVLGAGVGAGIRGARALTDLKNGDYVPAAINVGEALLGTTGIKAIKPLMWLEKERAWKDVLSGRILADTPEQAQADKGADWLRSWIEGRANASMGGLTPADAQYSQAITRPVVVDPTTWERMGFDPSVHGAYGASGNIATVNANTPNPLSVAVHEGTHQFQHHARESPGMVQGLDQLQRQTPESLREAGDHFKYWADPIEIQARLMQLRQELRYRPDEFITPERYALDTAKYRKPEITESPLIDFDYGGLFRHQVVDWLNNTPSVALPVAGVGAAAAATMSQSDKPIRYNRYNQ